MSMAERNSVYYYKNGSTNRAEPAEVPEYRKNRQKKTEKKPNITVRQTEARSGSVFTIILISVLAIMMLGSVIYVLNRRNTVYNSVAEIKNELNLIEAENVRLQSELESRMTAKNVEDYAENVLGMKKLDSSQVEYIEIQKDDVVNIPQQEEGLIAKLEKLFNRCVEYFRG